MKEWDVTKENENKKSWAEEYIEKAMDYLSDSGKKLRFERKYCKFCFYIASGIGGCAMTKSNCKCCGKEIMNGSTNVNRICNECSDEYNLCIKCGADLDYKSKRKDRFKNENS